MGGHRRLAVALVLALAVGLGSRAVCAQTGARGPKNDPRVKRLLESIPLKYEIDGDGDFKLVNDLGGGRSQAVFINSNTTRLGKLEIREVWSLAAMSDEPPSRERALELLTENDRVKLGSWRIKKTRGRYLMVFAAQIPADADKMALLLTMQAVTGTSDAMEKRISGLKDEY